MPSVIIFFLNSLLTFILLTWLGRAARREWRLNSDDLATTSLLLEEKQDYNASFRAYIKERIDLTRRFNERILGNIPEEPTEKLTFTTSVSHKKAQSIIDSFDEKTKKQKQKLNNRMERIKQEALHKKKNISAINSRHRRIYRSIHIATLALRALIFLLCIYFICNVFLT